MSLPPRLDPLICVREFQENNRNLLACLDNMPMAIAVIRLELDETNTPVDFLFVYGNAALSELEKVSLDRLIGSFFYRDIFPDGDRKWLIPYWETASQGTVQTLNDFSPEIGRFLEIKCYQPSYGFCTCILTDVSEKVRLERELEDARRCIDIALRNTLDGIFFYDMEKRFIVNGKNTGLRLKNLPARFDNVPQSFVDYGIMRPESLPLAEDLFRRLDEGAEEVSEEFELNLTGKENDFQWYKVTYIVYKSPSCDKKRVLAMTRNINEEVLYRRHLEQEASTDPLTRLLNRKTAQKRIGDIADTSLTKAFFLFDLDDFKGINDTYGHQLGDATLCFFAKVLKDVFAEEDIVFRLGGDEFAAFTQGSGAAFVEGICERIFAALATQAEFPFPLHTCIGIGLGTVSGHAYTELYHTADKALYLAKKAGKNKWHMEALPTEKVRIP